MEDFVVRCNPETGMIDHMEAMRYLDFVPQAKKILWITTAEKGESIAGTNISRVGSATWLDQGRPWATFTLACAHSLADRLTAVSVVSGVAGRKKRQALWRLNCFQR